MIYSECGWGNLATARTEYLNRLFEGKFGFHGNF